MERRDKLISEIVTDRILGMKMENGIISDITPGENDEFRKKGIEISVGKQFETGEPQTQFEKLLSKNHLSKFHLSRQVDPLSSLTPLNVSELTEPSFDQIETDRNNAMRINEERR